MQTTPAPPVHPHGRTHPDLDPAAVHRDAVHLRDDYRCLAAGTAWAVIHPCGGGLALHPAHPTAETPLLLRTLCTVHATAATTSSEFTAAATRYGWTLPGYRINPVAFARLLPVRYPDGGYYVLDDWADRQPVDLLTARCTRMRLGLIDRRHA